MRDDARATRPHDASRAQTIRIVLRHAKGDDTFMPRELTCQDYEDGKGVQHKGCGGTVWRYKTYPNRKSMRFDGPPVVIEGSQAWVGDLFVASVETKNVHYSTCPAKKAESARPTTGFGAPAGGVS
jgi:hypothetical protein